MSVLIASMITVSVPIFLLMWRDGGFKVAAMTFGIAFLFVGFAMATVTFWEWVL